MYSEVYRHYMCTCVHVQWTQVGKQKIDLVWPSSPVCMSALRIFILMFLLDPSHKERKHWSGNDQALKDVCNILIEKWGKFNLCSEGVCFGCVLHVLIMCAMPCICCSCLCIYCRRDLRRNYVYTRQVDVPFLLPKKYVFDLSLVQLLLR